MNCEIKQNLVGCRVAIELTTDMKIEGLVHSVNPNGSDILLHRPVAVRPEAVLPTQYRIFAKDIDSVTILEHGNIRASAEPFKRSFPSPVKDRIKPLIQYKTTPPHIRNINNEIHTDVLVNKVPQLNNGQCAVKLTVGEHLIIEKIDGAFYHAVKNLLQEKVIGVSMEGINIGRLGVICWLGIATKDSVYLFDMCSLGPSGAKQGLADVLHHPDIVKVVHDCRFLSDALLHQYDIKIENVFDTQVAASVVEHQSTGSFNKFVITLNRCLAENLNFPKEVMFQSRIRVGHEQEDAEKWTQRPLPQHLIEGAVFNVCHLRNLRLVLIEKLLSAVTIGTNLYLKEISSLPDDAVPEKMATSHLIPLSFQKLTCFQNPNNKNGNETFHSSVTTESLDPYVKFARNIPRMQLNS